MPVTCGNGVHAAKPRSHCASSRTRSPAPCTPCPLPLTDTQGVTLPVSLTMATTLPVDPIIGQRYEAPFIGTSIYGGSFTNRKPAAMQVTLTATVSGLTIGRAYVLYQYKTSTSPLPKGPLAVPSANFNANAAMASATTRFTASGTTYTARVSVLSSDTVVFRCVPATAP